MKTSNNPKVFISHASEDKERFVIDFATKLRSNGVDAWIDQWEINVGDSLIDKIFEQGISEADSFIIVLSHNSINKPWVKEELNAASIKRIEKSTKIIPVIIDRDVNVPEVLKTTVWETIENVNNYDTSLKKILSSIYGVYEKPEIGNRPVYALKNIEVEGLSTIDSAIFKAIGKEVFNTTQTHIEEPALKKIIGQLEISEDDMIDSLEILENDYLLKQTKFLGSQLPMIQLEYDGVLKYAENFIENFESIYDQMISLIVNGETLYSQTYALKLKCSNVLTDALIQNFDSKGYVKIHNTISSGIGIFEITVLGKRYFREYLNKVVK